MLGLCLSEKQEHCWSGWKGLRKILSSHQLRLELSRKAQPGICLHSLWVMRRPWWTGGRLTATTKINEKIKRKRRTMVTVRPATRLALVFSRSSSVLQSARRDPSELSVSSLLPGEAGSSELSDRIVSEATL